MIDWDQAVLAPLAGVFGEQVTYAPATGLPFTVTGVFDEAYREVDLASGTAFTTEMPVLGVRLAEFPQPPVQGDRYTVGRLALVYVVREVRLDSHGAAKLMSNLVGPA